MMRNGRLILYAVIALLEAYSKEKKLERKTALQCRRDSSEMCEAGNVLCVLQETSGICLESLSVG